MLARSLVARSLPDRAPPRRWGEGLLLLSCQGCQYSSVGIFDGCVAFVSEDEDAKVWRLASPHEKSPDIQAVVIQVSHFARSVTGASAPAKLRMAQGILGLEESACVGHQGARMGSRGQSRLFALPPKRGTGRSLDVSPSARLGRCSEHPGSVPGAGRSRFQRTGCVRTRIVFG